MVWPKRYSRKGISGIEYIVQNGMMKDLSVLQDPPFTDQGNIIEVFTDISVWMGIRRVIEQVNANALAA